MVGMPFALLPLVALAIGAAALLVAPSLSWRSDNRFFPAACLAALVVALLAVLAVRGVFLVTAALMIPILALFFWGARGANPCEAAYLGCVSFLLYDLGLLIGINVLEELLQVVAPSFQGLARDVLCAVVAMGTMIASSWLLGRRWPPETYRLSLSQSLLILVPMVPYLYIRSGIYMMAFNGWVAAPYQGEVILILLSLVPTIVVMVSTKNGLNAQINKNDLLRMQSLLTQQHQQYLVKRQTIDLMNRKYHDMKHFASVLHAGNGAPAGEGVGEGAGARDQSDEGGDEGILATDRASATDRISAADHVAREVEAVLLPYSEFVETGNPLLDVIVVDKIERGNSLGVRVLPLIDARDIGFVGSLDLCTIFGNALDNAIEAASMVPDPDRREVKVRVATRGRMIAISVTNPYEVEPIMRAGLPVFVGDSARPAAGMAIQPGHNELGEPPLHGYGVSNIRTAVETYGGHATFSADGGSFTFNALIPFPD